MVIPKLQPMIDPKIKTNIEYLISKLVPLPADLEERIKSFGLLTGSYAYGFPTEESDVDVFIHSYIITENTIPEECRCQFSDLNDSNGYLSSGFDFGETKFYYVKFSSPPRIINLIICGDNRTLDIWKQTTVAMRLLKSLGFYEELLEDKQRRILTFREIFTLYKEGKIYDLKYLG